MFFRKRRFWLREIDETPRILVVNLRITLRVDGGGGGRKNNFSAFDLCDFYTHDRAKCNLNYIEVRVDIEQQQQCRLSLSRLSPWNFVYDDCVDVHPDIRPLQGSLNLSTFYSNDDFIVLLALLLTIAVASYSVHQANTKSRLSHSWMAKDERKRFAHNCGTLIVLREATLGFIVEQSIVQ